MPVVFVYPGQGSQSVGMGKALAEHATAARQIFDEVDDALGEKLSSIIWDGPDDALTLTENAQPALMAVSMAATTVLRAEIGQPDTTAHAVAGHSLGEYSALAAAGALTVGDAARLLRIRGRAMQAAVPVGEGAMAALLGITLEKAAELATAAAGRGGVCEVANDNATGQVVLSGSKAAVDAAVAEASDFGARRAIPLNVSAPFHCSMMQPAADAMAEALADVAIKAPMVPLIANVTAGPVSDPDVIRRNLVAQVTGTVRWRESMQGLVAAGVTHVVEMGPGKVLQGLARQAERTLVCAGFSAPDDLDAVRTALAPAQS